MSYRERNPRVQLPRSHYFISFARGGQMSTFALRPWTLWAGGCALTLLLAWSAGATAYVAFRDQMLGAYLARQADMQAAYEDRLADARTALDRVASRQLLDQNSFEGKLHELLSRQALLEQRGEIVSQIVREAGAHGGTSLPEAHARATPKPASALSAFNGLSGVSPPASANAYAPMDSTLDFTPNPGGKPRPLDEPQKHSALEPSNSPARPSDPLLASADNASLEPNARLRLVGYSLDRAEHEQVSALQALDSEARRFNERWRAVIAKTGLPLDQITAAQPKDVGGPYIPVGKDGGGSEFDKDLQHAARDVSAMAQLKRTLPFLPIRAPLIGDARETSPFGYRTDPFLGRPALHPGVDLVLSYGSEIHATGAGKVIHAGWMGGYGNMVEVDHGGGVSTRYGHMSEVQVSEGDEVKAGDVLGLVGSTGRSTGPHLHYEVRIDGEPVDPERYLEVAASLRSS